MLYKINFYLINWKKVIKKKWDKLKWNIQNYEKLICKENYRKKLNSEIFNEWFRVRAQIIIKSIKWK